MTVVTREEVVSEEVELLPSRETLAFVNRANVSATNVAVGSNTYTLSSLSAAEANQAVVVAESGVVWSGAGGVQTARSPVRPGRSRCRTRVEE